MGRGRVEEVILENGAIRTMDPSLPLGRALAIAGELVAGGVEQRVCKQRAGGDGVGRG